MEPSTVSLTPLAIVAPGLVASTITLSFGHSPAWARVAASSKADPARRPRRIRAETANWVILIILCFSCCQEVQHCHQAEAAPGRMEGSIVFDFYCLQLCLTAGSRKARRSRS